MSFFINEAWAQAAPATPQQSLMSFLPLVALFVVFYFFLIRPQMRRQKEHAEIVKSISKGDEVVTTGGLLGRVTEAGDTFLKLEIAKNVEVRIQRHAINSVLPKGTIKEI
jgi:preprotein translocase subunit YajC